MGQLLSLSVLFFFGSGTALAGPANPYLVGGRDWSAVVHAYEEASERGDLTPTERTRLQASLLRQLPPELRLMFVSAGDPTVRRSAVPYAELDLASLPRIPPEYGSIEEFQAEFELRRDEQFLDDPDASHGDFVRRITWLYPPNGCYARSLLMSQGLETMGLVRPLTLFVFPLDPTDVLTVETPWSPTGKVSWGFHVVPVVLSEGELVVLDAAIDPSGPMSLEAWLLTMLPSPEDAQVAICGEYAYLPDESCWNSPARNDIRAEYAEGPLMHKEWNNLERLGYDPYALLGDEPPWLVE